MDLRKSFLKPFKRLKDKLPGDRRRRGGRSGERNDGEGGETDIETSEASQRNSYLDPEVDIGVVVESGPSREGNHVDGEEVAPVDDPPTSTAPLILRSGKPGGA